MSDHEKNEETTKDPCPCGSGASYADCCGPLHEGGRAARDPVELLRSRYAAFVKEKVDYVLETTDPEQRHRVDRGQTEQWAREAEWLGLEIRSVRGGSPEEDEGWVEFCARYRQEEIDVEHVERAHFVRRDGRWWFDPLRSGPPPLEPARPVGRNDPCPCGSGRKYKKCCGRAG